MSRPENAAKIAGLRVLKFPGNAVNRVTRIT